ncbi:dCTP deaminase [Streptomyces sp. NBC_00439]|uniref:dCTP deaminase n=1 Tax=unclassified Streptomyces TaxID=2593676 RepID=UPI00224DAAA8|nr:dCTP deaminase [Streptomyces sp. NBC_00439]MCX5103670.1 dCTP deaminase [Streptomyces sp. NBC_00439]WSX06186.1 dCTP deaminase [Streptomyces sp. NBC_00987]
MILTGPQITQERQEGRLCLEPFDPARVQPNSYDVALGPTLLVYTSSPLDVRADNPTEELAIPPQGLELRPDRIYLGATAEVVGSDHYVPMLHARSGAARLGLFCHVTADLIDVGSRGQLTFQLHAVEPLIVHAGDVLGQVTFMRVQGERMLYQGKYQGSVGPQASRVHLDTKGVMA